ncbi:MAG: citrate synthase [Rhodospirillaceae bacterium]
MARSITSRRSPAAGKPAADGFLTAREVTQILRIKKETLYAYVSRGLIRSAGGDRKNGYVYRLDDVERLRARGQARTEGSLYKAGAPRWSEPVVHTAITSITAQGPVFRGRPALALERAGYGFESVADFLWTGALSEPPTAWPAAAGGVAMDRLLDAAAIDRRTPDVTRLFAMLVAGWAGGDDLREGTTIPAARALLAEMPRCLGYMTDRGRFAPPQPGLPVAEAILRAAGAAATPPAAAAVNAALVLLIDHELTPQTVAARLAASNGSSLHFCLLAALGAHSGSRIRRACDRIEDILLAAGDPEDFRSRIGAASPTHPTVPGFNHPLYPKGDPRAKRLIEIARALPAPSPRGFRFGPLLDEMLSRENALPSCESGLVILCQTLGLPYRSAGAILLMTRCAGWVAHVIEQRLAGTMLRPRARFQGVASPSASGRG